MKRNCSYKHCGKRRIHHERQDEERGTQQVDVPDDYPIDKPVYCSMTCSIMDGAMSLEYKPIDKSNKT